MQDIDGNDTFFDDGLITADFDNAFAVPYQNGFANVGGQFRLALQNLVDLESLKLTRGKMLFSSELAEQEIVVQYVSDGKLN
jgi:hypothetical protein